MVSTWNDNPFCSFFIRAIQRLMRAQFLVDHLPPVLTSLRVWIHDQVTPQTPSTRAVNCWESRQTAVDQPWAADRSQTPSTLTAWTLASWQRSSPSTACLKFSKVWVTNLQRVQDKIPSLWLPAVTLLSLWISCERLAVTGSPAVAILKPGECTFMYDYIFNGFFNCSNLMPCFKIITNPVVIITPKILGRNSFVVQNQQAKLLLLYLDEYFLAFY